MSTPLTRAELVFRALGAEWVVYDPTSGLIHVLNPTSALVWSLCDGLHDVSAIVVEVRELLDGAPDVESVGRDVERAIEQFRAEGLLV